MWICRFVKNVDSKYSCHVHCAVSSWQHVTELSYENTNKNLDYVQTPHNLPNYTVIYVSLLSLFTSNCDQLFVVQTRSYPWQDPSVPSGINHYNTMCFTFNVHLRLKLTQTIFGIQFPSFIFFLFHPILLLSLPCSFLDCVYNSHLLYIVCERTY